MLSYLHFTAHTFYEKDFGIVADFQIIESLDSL